MAHLHLHASSHLPEDNDARRLLCAFGTTAGFILVEVIGNFLSDSLALLADAGYMLTDTAILFSVLLAMQFPRWPPTIHHTFDQLGLTALTAFVNTVAPVVITVLIIRGTIERFRTPRPVKSSVIMVTVVTGLLANILSFWLLHHDSKEKNLNVRATALHVLEGLLGSVGAIIAVLIIIWTGWTLTDPILSILVSLLVLRGTWRLSKGSMNGLLEGAPVPLDIAKPRRRLCREIPGVRNVHHAYVWMVDGKLVATLHVQMIPPRNRGVLSDQVQRYLIDHYRIERTTIQMECQPCHGPDCHLNEGVSGHSHHHH